MNAPWVLVCDSSGGWYPREGTVATLFPQQVPPAPIPSRPEPCAQDTSPSLIPRDRPERRTADARGTKFGPLCQARRTSPRGTRQPQPADPLQDRRKNGKVESRGGAVV